MSEIILSSQFYIWFGIIILIVLAILASYREVGDLIDRGSWNKEVTWLKFWEIEWQSIWRVFDPHHFSFGVFILILSFVFAYLFFSGWYIILWTGILWLSFFYIRNIGMHIIFMADGYRRWVYLIPIIGGYFDKTGEKTALSKAQFYKPRSK